VLQFTDNLPALRDDLEIMPGARMADGAPGWTLHDPVRQRFFRLGQHEFEVLRFWRPGSPNRVVEAVNTHTSVRVDQDQVSAIAQFFTHNQLTRTAGRGKQLYQQRQADKQALSTWLMKNYLFLRIPLLKPDGFLTRTQHSVRFIYTNSMLWLLLGMLALGTMLTVRQWESFVASFPHLFSWQGMLTLAVALLISKAVHEFGHAYTAKRYGVKVPTMGIALLVLWPVLYTDTTDSWRLPSRRQRLWISAAGMLAEFGLAVIALLLWNLMPDGPVRSGLFVLATTTWVTALLINANPFMRWDGYYLLSDLWGIENLQSRSFALGQWWLRKALFGFNHEPPEHLPASTHTWLVRFAIATWAYRFLLFLSIALLVYALFFKALGILLMAVELWWFIGRPIANEFSAWYRMKDELQFNWKIVRTLFGLSGLIALLVIPWNTRLGAPAVLEPAAMQTLYPPFAARLAEVRTQQGDWVESGQVLFMLDSPDLRFKKQQAAQRSQALQSRVQLEHSEEHLQERQPVLIQQWQEAQAEFTSYRDELGKLQVTAPFSGRIVALASDLKPGRWLPQPQALAVLADGRHMEAYAYLEESRLGLLDTTRPARYISDNPDIAPIPMQVVSVDTVAVGQLDKPMLASLFGGPIATRADQTQRLVPESALYRVTLRPTAVGLGMQQLDRGVVHLQGTAESLLYKAYRTVAGVLIRETGF
jgi:putative peptide zinc metalloprotease protein